MSQPNTGPNNWQMAENNAAVTSPYSDTSVPSTGPKHYQILENAAGEKVATQGIRIGGSAPSTTGHGHYQRLENSIASSTALKGLGGRGASADPNLSNQSGAGRNPAV